MELSMEDKTVPNVCASKKKSTVKLPNELEPKFGVSEIPESSDDDSSLLLNEILEKEMIEKSSQVRPKKTAQENSSAEAGIEEVQPERDECKESHCHQEISNEIVDDSMEVFSKEVIGSLSAFSRPSLAQKMNFVRGPQINIENLHLDFSTKQIFQVKFCPFILALSISRYYNGSSFTVWQSWAIELSFFKHACSSSF